MPLIDYIALAWLVVLWFSYGVIADSTRISQYSMTAYMRRYRRQWARMLLQRDNRIVDAGLQSNLLHGVAFFASTSIFAIGGSLALLGASEAALDALAHLPMVNPGNLTQWTLKIAVLTVIFIYAFFKFAWAFRLFNYGSTMIGGAPAAPVSKNEQDTFIRKYSQINNLGALQMNRGIRAYFFALATLSWMVNTIIFMGAVALVIVILVNREFGTRKAIESHVEGVETD